MKFNTTLLHGGFEPEKTTGSTLTPIYQVSAFAQESAEQLEKVFNNKAPGYAYTRISNPTVAAFENRMNTLERCWRSGVFIRHGGCYNVASEHS